VNSEIILAIDPGTFESAVVFWDGNAVMPGSRIALNHEILAMLRINLPATVCVEMFASFGMPVGKEVFETCLMIGRIQEICATRLIPCRLVYRKDVKLHHCHDSRAKDPNIRRALIDKYGPPGTKKAKGRTYGLASHLWAAFAIATFVSETDGRPNLIKEVI
jgi:hypothetical protein